MYYQHRSLYIMAVWHSSVIVETFGDGKLLHSENTTAVKTFDCLANEYILTEVVPLTHEIDLNFLTQILDTFPHAQRFKKNVI